MFIERQELSPVLKKHADLTTHTLEYSKAHRTGH